MNSAELLPTNVVPDLTLRLAVAAYLARFKGQSRVHTESDLRCYLSWCSDRELAPLEARRPHVELYLRWMQEVPRFQPSTVSRRLSVVAGFYRTCVIDGLLEHSPAEYVGRPHVSAESPTLGLSHLLFEALQVSDVGAGGFEDPQSQESKHRHQREVAAAVHGKGDKLATVPLPPAVGRALDRAIDQHVSGPILRNRRDARMSRHTATRRLHHLAQSAGVSTARMHPHMLRHTYVTTMLDAGVDLRDVQIAARHADPRTTMRYDRARKNLDRHPNYILAAYMASGT